MHICAALLILVDSWSVLCCALFLYLFVFSHSLCRLFVFLFGCPICKQFIGQSTCGEWGTSNSKPRRKLRNSWSITFSF